MKINGITSEISFFTGKGGGSMKMFRGYFDVKDEILERSEAGDSLQLSIEEKNGLTYII